MSKKAYILNFDKEGGYDTFNYVEFHNTLITTKGIINWWHYLESSYILIVESNITATNISDFIRQIAPNKYFFVAEIKLENHNGWLPQEAWEWINKYKNQNPFNFF